MVLKFIKGMAPRNTEAPWQISAPVICTERPFRESKSSFERGVETEDFVAQFLIQKKCKILERRLKTPFGEVDLLIDSLKGNLVMIEVKSLSDWDRILYRLSAHQKSRLLRARVFLESSYGRAVLLKVAYVDAKKNLAFLDT